MKRQASIAAVALASAFGAGRATVSQHHMAPAARDVHTVIIQHAGDGWVALGDVVAPSRAKKLPGVPFTTRALLGKEQSVALAGIAAATLEQCQETVPVQPQDFVEFVLVAGGLRFVAVIPPGKQACDVVVPAPAGLTDSVRAAVAKQAAEDMDP